MAIKHQRKRREIRSRSAAIRVREGEWAGLVQLADSLGQTPSRILRRLLREAITGGPDYFKDELRGLRFGVRQLAKIGNNLNQIARALNRGERVELGEFKRVMNATRLETAALRALYNQSLESVRQRTTGALSGDEPDV